MKKVITVGVFDFFHLGHLNVLEAAKKYGDYLIVAVHDDKENTKGVEFLYSLEERMRFVGSIKFVDEVIPYERVDTLLEAIDFDIFVFGPDQNHKYFQKAFEWCRKNKKELIMLERTEGISSTRLREVISKKEI
ncbi:Glycerol-3-phosphate cytidylyltransferase [Porphyromonadaceae bacterium NLAE-zl-C104]|nr:Glycerol-3-phosphate cytidylyltransferase [Porphyromonadaceae bacterium NLAE-zl-C104]